MVKESRIRPTSLPSRSDRVNPTKYRDEKVSFNFRHLIEKDNKFLFSEQEKGYFLKFLERLKSVSGLTRKEMTVTQAHALRCHPIKFGDPTVSESTFGVIGNQGEDVDEDAWQFQICSNAHGRIHGYFIENTFYVVWLDPQHELYPGQK